MKQREGPARYRVAEVHKSPLFKGAHAAAKYRLKYLQDALLYVPSRCPVKGGQSLPATRQSARLQHIKTPRRTTDRPAPVVPPAHPAPRKPEPKKTKLGAAGRSPQTAARAPPDDTQTPLGVVAPAAAAPSQPRRTIPTDAHVRPESTKPVSAVVATPAAVPRSHVATHALSAGTETTSSVVTRAIATGLRKYRPWFERRKLSKGVCRDLEWFGIRVELQCSSPWTSPPLYDMQRITELLRLDPSFKASEHMKPLVLKRRLKAILCEKLKAHTPGNHTNLSVSQLYKKMKVADPTPSYRNGTVVSYSNGVHRVVFDQDVRHTTNKTMRPLTRSGPYQNAPPAVGIKLSTAPAWRRVPWPDHILDPEAEHGERPESGIRMHGPEIGPPCPKCYAPLGVGALAWSECSVCHHNEPGADCSLRCVKHDPYAWQQPSYTDPDDA